MFRRIFVPAFFISLVAGCTSTETVDACAVRFQDDLERSMSLAEDRLENGCEYRFDGYFQSLLAIAAENPDSRNPMLFSDHLMRVNDMGVISKRQAECDYNTCSQTCPMRDQVMSDMRAELHDKELGLMRASADRASFYRADTLLKEADLVLEATCRACGADGR
jgi:hypothetical protein